MKWTTVTSRCLKSLDIWATHFNDIWNSQIMYEKCSVDNLKLLTWRFFGMPHFAIVSSLYDKKKEKLPTLNNKTMCICNKCIYLIFSYLFRFYLKIDISLLSDDYIIIILFSYSSIDANSIIMFVQLNITNFFSKFNDPSTLILKNF